MYMNDKDIRLSIRISEKDNQLIEEIIKQTNQSKSEYIRNVIQQNIAGYQLAQQIIENIGVDKAKELIKKYGGN